MSDSFYRALEDRHRGSRETIKARLRAYLPFLKPLAALHPRGAALDLGCGRGEWLEVARDAGFIARGIDMDETMVEACRDAGLSAAREDAVAALRAAPAGSLALVSGFHLAEHIAFAELRELVREALRVLQPGGLLVLETPNPENIVVGTAGFYLDPTHQRPLHPGLLAFLPEHCGFHRTKVVRLQEAPWLNPETATSILSVLRDTSADYAVVAQKTGPTEALASFEPAFQTERGLTLEAVGTYYDAHLERRVQQAEAIAWRAETRAQQAEARTLETEARALETEARVLETEARTLETEARTLETEAAVRGALDEARAARGAASQAEANTLNSQRVVEELLASKSWRLTAPLRAVFHALKSIRGK